MEIIVLSSERVMRWTPAGLEKAKVTFERGKVARAERDVQARRLEKKSGIKTPYALATYQIKKGDTLHGVKGDVKKEFKEQKAAKKDSDKKKEEMCKECGEMMVTGRPHAHATKSLRIVVRRLIPKNWV